MARSIADARTVPLPQAPAHVSLDTSVLLDLPVGALVRRWWGSGDYDVSDIAVREGEKSLILFGQRPSSVSTWWTAPSGEGVHTELLYLPGQDVPLLTAQQASALPPGSIVVQRSIRDGSPFEQPWHRGRGGWELHGVQGAIEHLPEGTLGLVSWGTPYDERLREQRDPTSLESVRERHYQLVDAAQGHDAAVRALEHFDAAIAATLAAAAKSRA